MLPAVAGFEDLLKGTDRFLSTAHVVPPRTRVEMTATFRLQNAPQRKAFVLSARCSSGQMLVRGFDGNHLLTYRPAVHRVIFVIETRVSGNTSRWRNLSEILSCLGVAVAPWLGLSEEQGTKERTSLLSPRGVSNQRYVAEGDRRGEGLAY